MPAVLSRPIKWAQKVAKSLKKRLHIKSSTRRVHCYVPKEKGGDKQAPPKKRTVGIQVSLPSRSILDELSHEGNIDVMAHTYGDSYWDNYNQNNSVDTRTSHSRVSPAVSKPAVSKPRVAEARTTGVSTGSHSSSAKMFISSGSVLPSKVSVPTKSTKTTSRSTDIPSSSLIHSSQGSTSLSKSKQRDAATSTDHSYRYSGTHSSSPQQGTLSTTRRSRSPSRRSMSITEQVSRTTAHARASRSPSPSLGRRSSSFSSSDSGRSSQLLQKRLHSTPASILKPSSPPPPGYKATPILSSDERNLQRLLNQEASSLPGSSKPHRSHASSESLTTPTSRHLIDRGSPHHSRSRSPSIRSHASSESLAKPSAADHTQDTPTSRHLIDRGSPHHSRSRSPSIRQQASSELSGNTGLTTRRSRSLSVDHGSSPRHRQSRSPSTYHQTSSDSLTSTSLHSHHSPSHSQCQSNTDSTQTPLSDARQRRAAEKRNDSNNNNNIIAGNFEESIIQSLSKTNLRKSASIASIADALKSKEKVKSSDSMKTQSRGQFDDIRDIDVQVEGDKATPTTGKRKNSPKSRVKSLLKKVKSRKKTTGQAVQVNVPDNSIEQMFVGGGLVGLHNLGNTCYMNSMLQCLSHTLEMTQIFLQPDFNNTKCLTRAYTRLMKEMWSKTTPLSHTCSGRFSSVFPSVLPHKFKRTIGSELPQYSGAEQHDAQEFMRYLVSLLHDEMKMEVSRKYSPFQFDLGGVAVSVQEQGDRSWHMFRFLEDSFISEVFMGQLSSTLTCTVCGKSSVTFDPFWDLCLSIPENKRAISAGNTKALGVTLEDCFAQFSQAEIMDGDNKPVCSHCGKAQRSIKQMGIQRFPPVLVLMIKRFTGYRYRSKLDTKVATPQLLDLTHLVNEESRETSVKYELYATSNHHGGVNFGHYTAWAKHYATQEWYEFDDSRVRKMDSSDAVMSDTVISSDPYVLFYRRVTTDH